MFGDIILFVLGVIFGGIVTNFIYLYDIDGELRIDRSVNKTYPNLFLEIEHSPEKLYKKKIVVFRVKNKSFYE